MSVNGESCFKEVNVSFNMRCLKLSIENRCISRANLEILETITWDKQTFVFELCMITATRRMSSKEISGLVS